MTQRDAALHALMVWLIIGLFVLQPVADLGLVPNWLPGIVTLGTLVAGLLTMRPATRLLLPLIGCGLLLAAALGLGTEGVEGMAAVGGLLLLCISLLRQVLAPGEVTRARLEGAIALYLLIALLFATAYETLAAVAPDAFTGAVGLRQDFRYFSLVVQTSTGFGDILPAVPLARTLVTLQAVTGQMFIAIVLARLVSLELAGRGK